MGKLRRKPCDGARCKDPGPSQPFFKPAVSGDAPAVQKEEAPDVPDKEEEKKDPLTEGLKITGEQLFKHEPFKLWFKKQYQPLLGTLKADFWDNTSGGEKALLLSYAGINLGIAALAFAQSPELRKTLSGVNLGALGGLIPYSPLESFKYKLPDEGKSNLGLSAGFTLNPYLDLWKNRPGFMPNSATFGLESSYDTAGGGFDVTGGNLKLGFLDGALNVQGGIFDQKSISRYPLMIPGVNGGPPGMIMNEIPGMPDIKAGAGWEVGASVDLWKIPWFRRKMGEKK